MSKKTNPVRTNKGYVADGEGRFVKDLGWKKVIRYAKPALHEQVQNNDTSAYVPEKWAAESIMTLNEAMVFAGTVHRDFENEIAEFGDTVHTREPGQFTSKRKQNDRDSVVRQDATARKVEVKLDQRIHVTFGIPDGAQSLSFKDLVREFLTPAVIANGRMIDKCLAAEVVQFRANAAGSLNGINATNGHEYMLDTRNVMNINKVGQDNRWLAVAPNSENALQKVEMFKSAEKVGDMGQALRDAYLGRKAGFDSFLELNTPSARGAATGTFSTTTTAAVEAGSTVIPMTSVSGLDVGQYFTVAGDNTPLRVASIATLDVTVTTPTVGAIANGAAVTGVDQADVNQSSAVTAGDNYAAKANGYPAGWAGGIEFDGGTTPVEGQLVSFADNSAEYVIIEVDGTAIHLDRMLEADIDDNDAINLGPNGDMNFAYQRDALCLVNRPLIQLPPGIGVRSGVATMSQMSVRVTLGYDMDVQEQIVTVDALFGKKTLNAQRGAAMYG